MNPVITSEPGKSRKSASGRLADINRAITTSLNFDKVLDLIVENATQLVGARVCVLLLVDKDGMLRIRAARGLHPELAKEFVAEMGENAVKALHRVLSVGADEVLVSVPVIAKHAVNGFLAIVRDHPLDADEEWQLSAAKSILVVDDSRESTEMLTTLLKTEGARVASARSGEDALRLVRENNFDLVISDISMPAMDGYQLLQEIRAISTAKQVPALALTGYGRSADVERARAAGFTHHLTKPLDIARLLEIVRELTEGSGF